MLGDYNNDGWLDIYVTNYEANQFWRNNGDGTFSDVTAITQTSDRKWGVSAAFLDFDKDGWLDLYIVNYVEATYGNHKTCLTTTGETDYCGPASYPDALDTLFRNRGDGTFEDVSLPSGIISDSGAGLGIVAADFNGDDWVDIYVANDVDPNFLWLNQKNGTFINDALFAGFVIFSQFRF